MKKKIVSFSLMLSTLAVASSDMMTQPRWAMRSNGTMNYIDKAGSAQNVAQMFQDGKFYGRLRNNNFYFWYDAPEKTTHLIGGLGGSLIFHSASLSGFDFTVGLYGSRAFFDETNDPVNAIKSGKDTLSRYKFANSGSKVLATFAQANIRYSISKTDLTVGRQLVESFYTKSNDTKMIPNSFDGVVLHSQDLSKTQLTLGYLAKQKLRDHEDAHAVLMVGDANLTSSNRPQWSEQDDSAMHRGLTYSALLQHGKPTRAPLLIADITNRSVKNLKLHAAGYNVPKLLSQLMCEADYTLRFSGFSLTPAIRYIHQFDHGAGDVGGANYLTSDTSNYVDPNSLVSDMIAGRLVLKKAKYNLNLAYTQVLDKADLITPWRGFPTAGYTRSMGVYNWRANTKSYRLQLTYGGNKTGIYTDGFIQGSVLYIDGDQSKDLNYDRVVYYLGYIKNLKSLPQFQYRVRVAYKDYLQTLPLSSGAQQSLDFVDARLEFNYLF